MATARTIKRVRIPQVADLKTAIELYITRTELSSKDIEKLFGKMCKDTVVKLKHVAREKMAEKGTAVWNASCVNTAVAYEAWGLDINDLKRRHRELKELEALET